MTITILVNGKKISKKSAVEKYGRARMEQRIKDAIEEYHADPMTLVEWADGMEIKVRD